MRYVETELVCFLDADDYVVGPHRQAMEAIWRDDVDMIIGLRADGDDDQVHLQAKNKYRDDPDPLAILGRFLDDDCVQCSTISWSVAFLKQIGAWDNDMRGIDDIELAMRALLHRPRLRLSEAPAWVVWHNHTHPGRLSQVMDEAVARSHVRAQEKTISLIDSTGAGDEVLRQALQRCMKEGRRLYLNGRPAEAIELFAMARARRYATHYGPRFERLLAAILGTRTVLFLRTVNTSAKHRLRRWLTAFGRPEANTSPAASIH